MSPLHIAVIKDLPEQVRKLARVPAFATQTDHLGFTPLDLAQLLDRQDCQKELIPNKPRRFLVRVKDNKLQDFSLAELEETFEFHYLPYLNFGSYEELERLVHYCPLLQRFTPIGNPYRYFAIRYAQELKTAYVAPCSIEWVNEDIGYGLFAQEDIPKGSFVATYTGRVRGWDPLHPDHNPYCLHYPTRFWSKEFYLVDSLYEGNETRFINHSNIGNLCLMAALDRGIQHAFFLARKSIQAGSQLTFNYGSDFWKKRPKPQSIDSQ